MLHYMVLKLCFDEYVTIQDTECRLVSGLDSCFVLRRSRIQMWDRRSAILTGGFIHLPYCRDSALN
jgi:hypothetical protein